MKENKSLFGTVLIGFSAAYLLYAFLYGFLIVVTGCAQFRSFGMDFWIFRWVDFLFMAVGFGLYAWEKKTGKTEEFVSSEYSALGACIGVFGILMAVHYYGYFRPSVAFSSLFSFGKVFAIVLIVVAGVCLVVFGAGKGNFSPLTRRDPFSEGDRKLVFFRENHFASELRIGGFCAMILSGVFLFRRLYDLLRLASGGLTVSFKGAQWIGLAVWMLIFLGGAVLLCTENGINLAFCKKMALRVGGFCLPVAVGYVAAAGIFTKVDHPLCVLVILLTCGVTCAFLCMNLYMFAMACSCLSLLSFLGAILVSAVSWARVPAVLFAVLFCLFILYILPLPLFRGKRK